MTQATDDFRESDHPRASNGQFGSGGTAHIVTGAYADDGSIDVLHVGTDEDEAHEAYAEAEDDFEDTDNVAEYHAPTIEGAKGQRSDALHIVHAADGSGGVDVHGAHLAYGDAREQATALSEGEWEVSGPDRSEFDRDQGEEDEAALAWNAEHAGDNDDVKVKVDADGNVERDEDGGLQWVQDGIDVDPTKDHLAAFDDVFEDMFPADETTAYPGLDAANDHFEEEGRHESVFRIHTHKAGARDAAMTGDRAQGVVVAKTPPKRSAPRRDRFALDRSSSVRRFDPDSGHLHVSRTPISKANVCPYYGREIPGWEELGLDGDRVYKLYRHPEELEKAAATANGKPLLVEHRVSSADDHPHRETAGAVNGAEWDAPYLYGGLDIWTRDAIDGVESGDRQELSPGYAYDPDMTPGTTPGGEKYDGVMRNIRFNHVSLVPEGRTGRDVYVHDKALTHRPRMKDILMAAKAVPSRTAAVASSALSGALHGALLTYARPRLAKDAALDVKALLRGVTVRNVKAKAPTIARAFDAAIKGKLAKDAEVEQSDVQEIVEQVGEMIAENAPDIAAAVEPDPDMPAEDGDDADLRALLKAKGYTDEEIDAICAKEAITPSAAATDAEKAKEDAVKGMDVKIAAAKREATAEARKGMIDAAAMDAAIASAVEGERKRGRDVHEAMEHVAASSVGKLVGAFDSAADVYRAGLKVLGRAEGETLHESALRSVFDAHAGVKAAIQSAPKRPAAQDAAARSDYEDRFPDAKRLKRI